jgi:hypothetical protein
VDPEAVNRARQFAQTAFTAARESIWAEATQQLAHIDRTFPRGGQIVVERAKIFGQRIAKALHARADALLEGYELHGVPIDEAIAKSIFDDVSRMRVEMVAGSRSALQDTSRLGGSISAMHELERLSITPLSAIKAQIERRRLMSKKEDFPSVTNIYHVYGHNPHWNVNSSDQSVNIVTISNEEVFERLRQVIASGIPAGDEQKDILARVEALERAEGSSSFARRYTEFISVAANHVTLLAPFIPALAEMLHKTLG